MNDTSETDHPNLSASTWRGFVVLAVSSGVAGVVIGVPAIIIACDGNEI
jgi:hypothetical protein